MDVLQRFKDESEKLRNDKADLKLNDFIHAKSPAIKNQSDAILKSEKSIIMSKEEEKEIFTPIFKEQQDR